MAAPTLQAQGTIAASTTADISVALPAYADGDIIVIQTVGFVPNTNISLGYGGAGFPTTFKEFSLRNETSSWTTHSNADAFGINSAGPVVFGLGWALATSSTSLGTTVTIARGFNWDTGADTCFAGRAYVIRGCDLNGYTPYNQDVILSTPSSAANPQIPQCSVFYPETLVIAFLAQSDNTTVPTAATGYTVGTLATTTTGTDASFQTYRQTANTDVSAVTPTGGALIPSTNGSAVYFVVGFRPNNPRRVLIT